MELRRRRNRHIRVRRKLGRRATKPRALCARRGAGGRRSENALHPAPSSTRPPPRKWCASYSSLIKKTAPSQKDYRYGGARHGASRFLGTFILSAAGWEGGIYISPCIRADSAQATRGVSTRGALPGLAFDSGLHLSPKPAYISNISPISHRKIEGPRCNIYSANNQPDVYDGRLIISPARRFLA